MSDAANASKELATAKRMVKAGEYSLVIPRLQQIISKFPGDSAAVEARFLLGKSYYQVGAYTDALRYLNEYVELSPEGDHAGNSREMIARLTDAPATVSPTEQDEQVAALEAAIAAAPEEMAPRLELAELHWTQGRYAAAGTVYTELLQRWPRLETDTVVRQRVERNASGALVVLTPEEVERRYRESEPLRIYNVSTFRSGRFEGWPAVARDRYYNVTGQAVNQSAEPLDDVRIIITIYGLGQMVYDTQTVGLGTLRPGETRAFNAQFSRFDNIHNITRHECVGTFRR